MSDLDRIRDELFALCEKTEEDCRADIDLPGYEGPFARGRIYEAKGIRRAMGEVFRLAKESEKNTDIKGTQK